MYGITGYVPGGHSQQKLIHGQGEPSPICAWQPVIARNTTKMEEPQSSVSTLLGPHQCGLRMVIVG